MTEDSNTIHNQQTIIIRESSESDLEKAILEDGFKRLGKFKVNDFWGIDEGSIEFTGVDGFSVRSYTYERLISIVLNDFFRKTTYQPNIEYIAYGKSYCSTWSK